MFMTALMFAFYTQDPHYETAMRKSLEATYAGSELKVLADQAAQKAREEVPALAAIAPAAYALGVKHEVKLTSSVITLCPGSVTSVGVNNKQAIVSVSWSY